MIDTYILLINGYDYAKKYLYLCSFLTTLLTLCFIDDYLLGLVYLQAVHTPSDGRSQRTRKVRELAVCLSVYISSNLSA